MTITRRQALVGAVLAGAPLSLGLAHGLTGTCRSFASRPPAYGIQPVLFDGKWIWREPPAGATGYVDEREFEVSVGVRWNSGGHATHLRSSTVAPVAFPEQTVVDARIETSPGCAAEVIRLTEGAGQFQVVAPQIERGQTIEARAVYRLRIARDCRGYQRDRFPARQQVSRPIASAALGNSPGIRADLNSVKQIVQEVASRHEHPWDLTKKFYDWVWENIQGVTGPYTSVQTAIQKRTGDCEERAGVFIALCRAAGIPARLVWVPNHSWAEFCLFDEQGIPHWIPSHTAAYNWFGWTGAHELVLQKGDRVTVPGQNKTLRLIEDWYSFKGRRPTIQFTGTVTPLAGSGQDPGPGKRRKDAKGAWNLVGDHPDDKIIRI